MSEDKRPVSEVAEAYLDAYKQDTDKEQLQAYRETLSELQERRETYREIHGPESDLVTRIDEHISEVESEIEDLQSLEEETDNLKISFLEACKDFRLNDEWLTLTVLRALNTALVDQEKSHIVIEETRIGSIDDVDDLPEMDLLDIEDRVRRLAMDALGESTHTNDIWNWMQSNNYDTAFQVIAACGEADRHDIAEELGDGTEPKDAKNILERPIYRGNLNPYVRQDGKFLLSTIGEYIAHHHAETGDNYEQPNGQQTLNEELPVGKDTHDE